MRECPHCEEPILLPDSLRAEINHMEDVHPEIIEQRLRDMGRPDIAEERARRRQNEQR